MESKKINQLATELAPELSDLTIIGDPTTGISKKITLSQMASLFTGTVEEYANLASFPLVGTADTIYIALDTNIIYRWNTGTSAYVELSPNIVTSLVFNDANGFDGTISLVGSTATLTITTALTQGSIGFIGASGALTQDNSNFFWDNTNKRLGINTNTPTTAIDAFGSGIIGRLNGTSTNNAFLGFASAGSNKWSIGNVQSDHRFRIYSEANAAELVSVLQTGEVGIGIANPLTKLHIFGGASALIANLDANTSVAKSISFRSGNSSRINLEVSGTESGSNAGANFFIRTYTDAGSLLETPFQITRSTGLATFKNIAITGLTTNKVLKSNGSATIVESTITDDGTNVAISGGFAATTYLTAASGTFTTAGKDGLVVSDSTTQATGVGGSILFKGVYTTGGSPLSFGRISLMKENSTNANYSFGLGFYTSANGGNNPSTNPNMYLAGSGNLGIGTTNPISKLSIGGDGYSDRAITAIANGTDFAMTIQQNSTGAGIQILKNGGNWGNNPFQIQSTSGGTQFVVNTLGNIGIGTNSPNGTVSIYQNNTSSTYLEIVNTNQGNNITKNAQLLFQLSDTVGTIKQAAFIAAYPSSGYPNVQWADLVFATRSSDGNPPVERLRLTGTGALISVFTYNNTTANAANIYMGSTGTFERSTSSIRFKTNIEDLYEDTSSLLYKMRPIWYRSLGNSDRKDWSWYGFIAEELAIIEPRLVYWTKDEEGKDIPDGVQYERITVLLTAEIQKLRKELDELKAK